MIGRGGSIGVGMLFSAAAHAALLAALIVGGWPVANDQPEPLAVSLIAEVELAGEAAAEPQQVGALPPALPAAAPSEPVHPAPPPLDTAASPPSASPPTPVTPKPKSRPAASAVENSTPADAAAPAPNEPHAVDAADLSEIAPAAGGKAGSPPVAQSEAGSRSAALTAPAGSGAPPRAAAGNPAPDYPMQARKRGIEGKVVVRASVTSLGDVREAKVAQSSGSRLLDEAALDAVKRWRFQPAQANGEPTNGSIDLPIVFRLID